MGLTVPAARIGVPAIPTVPPCLAPGQAGPVTVETRPAGAACVFGPVGAEEVQR